MIDGLTQTLGVKTLAGFIGGVLSLRFFDSLTVSGKVSTVGGGMASAFYLTHPIMEYFGWNAQQHEGGVGFIIGLFGMAMVASLFKVIFDTEILKSWLKKG